MTDDRRSIRGSVAGRAARCAALLLALAGGCAGNDIVAGGHTEKTDMSLEIELSLGAASLVAGADTPLAFVLTNAGGSPLTIPDPLQNPRWPEVVVRNARTGVETRFGPFSLGSKDANEFMPVVPDLNVSLDARQSLRIDSTLLARAAFDAPGEYVLTAHFEHAGGRASSAPVKLEIAPFDLLAAQIAGGHSGHNPYRYCAWLHNAGGAGVVGLTCHSFDQHGHATRMFSTRLADVGKATQVAISASANGLPYPRHWIAWIAGDELTACYENNGRVETTTRAHALGLPGATVLAPILLDLAGNDGSRPGRGEVLLWTSGGGERVSVRVIESDGSLSSGPTFRYDAGEMRWARAFLLRNGQRRWVVAQQAGGSGRATLADWDGGAAAAAPQTIAKWDGELLGAGASMNANDTVFGAAITARADGSATVISLRGWRTTADLNTIEEPPVIVRTPRDVKFDRAIVELSAEGNAIGLLHATDGRWYYCNRGGDVKELEHRPKGASTPIGAFWLHESEPQIVYATADSGIVVQDLHPHH